MNITKFEKSVIKLYFLNNNPFSVLLDLQAWK